MNVCGIAIPVQRQADGNLQQQEPAIQPHIEAVVDQVAAKALFVLQRRDLMQHPLAMAPPQAPTSVVVIVGLVRVLVVMAMQRHPVDRSALAGQGAHHHQHAFQPAGNLEAAVGHQAMQAEGDAQNSCPVENAEGDRALPAPKARQQSHGGQHVHHHHEGGGAAFELALSARQAFTGRHHRCAHAQFAGGACVCRSAGNQEVSP